MFSLSVPLQRATVARLPYRINQSAVLGCSRSEDTSASRAGIVGSKESRHLQATLQRLSACAYYGLSVDKQFLSDEQLHPGQTHEMLLILKEVMYLPLATNLYLRWL